MSQREGVPTEKAARIAAAILDGKSPKEALLAAGYSPSVAKSPGRVLEDANVRRALRVALELAGITPDKVASVLRDCLGAEKVELARCEGKITDERAYADHSIRLRAAEVCADILGGYKRVHGADADGPHMSIVIAPEYKQIFFGDFPDDPPSAATPAAATVEVDESPTSNPTLPVRNALDDWK